MKKMSSLLIGFILTGFLFANAQKLVTKSGNLDFLKNEKGFNVEFSFEGVTIGKDKKAEATFIKEKVDDNNAKNPGQGDKWLEDWSNAKSNKFPEKFYTLIKEELPVTIAVNPADGSAKFTCIVKSVNMEPGFKIGMSTIPAKVDFELIWVSSTEKSKILCVQTIENSPGSGAMGFDFTSSSRISESFAKAGKIVGKSLSKEVFK